MSRYRFIAAEKAASPVSLLCRALGVSRQSFYAWLERGPSARARADQQLLEQITRIHRPAGSSTPTVSMWAPGAPGFLTHTAMDTPGSAVPDAPRAS